MQSAMKLWSPAGPPYTTLLDQPLQYRTATQQNALTPNSSKSYDQKKPKESFRAKSFRIVVQRNAILTGFRTFLTDNGQFLNDCTILSDFDATPLYSKYSSNQKEGLACESSSHGLLLPETKPTVSIQGPVICPCSDEPSNYGSWLYRVLPKLISYRKHPILVYHPRPWMRELLSVAFGDVNLISHQPKINYEISEALIPSLRNIGVYFDIQTAEFYREMAERAGPKSHIEKVYLSRLGYPSKRPILNEREFVSRIEEMGFTALQPEKLQIKDQIRIIRDAKEIIVPGGSGLFNMVFANNARRVIDIEPNSTWLHAHRSLLASLGHHYTIAFGNSVENTPHGAWNINIPAVLDALTHQY